MASFDTKKQIVDLPPSEAFEQARPKPSDAMLAVAIGDLRRELEGMAAAVSHTRREIASIKPGLVDENRVSQATEEIALAISSTERAATDIMNVAERLQSLSGDLRNQGVAANACDEIEAHATNLMLACSFQDLTGQRMTKASNTLRYIEQRVNGLIQIWGVTGLDAAHEPQSDKLLHGPAKDHEAVSQDDIDRLIAEADDAMAPVDAGTCSNGGLK